MSYWFIIVILLILLLLLAKKDKREGFFTLYPYSYDYCQCQSKGRHECGNCANCGYCMDRMGNGQCVPGDENGPWFRTDCVSWEYTYPWSGTYPYYEFPPYPYWYNTKEVPTARPSCSSDKQNAYRYNTKEVPKVGSSCSSDKQNAYRFNPNNQVILEPNRYYFKEMRMKSKPTTVKQC